MDNRAEVSAFLKSRRGKITPEQAGLPVYGQRRVPGLRRNEVAMLAGVSVEYYTRLERGNLGGASDSVLDSLAQALRLNDVERDHLYALARAANSGPARVRRCSKTVVVRPSVLRILEGLHDQPAYLRNNRMDILAANPLARALHWEVFETEPVNTCRFAFLDPRATRFYPDWERVARQGVGALRVEVAKNPYDRELSNLIGELSTRSDAFRTMWGARDVHVFADGTKRFWHHAVGEMELIHEMLDLPGDDGLSITVYSADPGTPAADALKLLASWVATQHQDPASAQADSER
ncbi:MULTISPECIES: helix-turn-helix transcriptional regulator [Streptomyces]|uniref:Helix-turn-helix transcriptional regulator n=1 Tax=Streptomyces caniscabiei TaxID=2746961 RepID=A0ABU4N3X6_9ACTN|nr:MULTISPECIES: helix-turn-helix transcriptional regulator [Streptomyces]MBE4739584.1 helix-turn-helix domain-containing protein [Streptomyces caniscabiei]MBE4762261.1 helix-turn-helix domain-containing protein [Streptomyces caniscabiei]MBE4773571.1 helix-turn-helix domain-containing protein [Streptomyces caniscabiei]MBE4782736.1 helix-turn-helix domain-containing protein [Streptomyces caniscabiei]MBE4792039.1 helix-turn-helix domain-containing protein [Streptomyces caniscabiei]